MATVGKTWSPTDLWGRSSSLMCFRSGPSLVLETPSRQCRERFEGLGYKVSAKVDVAAYRRDVLGLGSKCYIWQHLGITSISSMPRALESVSRRVGASNAFRRV